jgi:hypothetical protein
VADDFSISIYTRELDAALANLPEKVQGHLAKRGLQAAGDLILESMKAHCPVATDDPTPGSNALPAGVLQESLTTQVQTGSKQYPPRVKVGAPKETSHVAYWIENGFDHYETTESTAADGTVTKSKSKRKGYGGKMTKHIEGKHFMAASFDESAQKAVDVLLSTLAEGLADNSTEGAE